MKRFFVGFVFCFAVQTTQQSRLYGGALALDLALVVYCSWKFGGYFQRRGVAQASEPDDETATSPSAPGPQTV